MKQVGSYDGIGDVFTAHEAGALLTHSGLREEEILPVSQFRGLIDRRQRGEAMPPQVVFSADLATVVQRSEIELLEHRGLSCVRYNEQHKFGTYALDAFSPQVSDPSFAGRRPDDLFVFHDKFFSRVAISSRAPAAMAPEDIEQAAFADISTNAQVVALCRRTAARRWEWGPAHVYPDGFHLQPALTTAEQYAQSCFEGMSATVNEIGEIILFRPEENAARFARSCAALAMPPLGVDQFLDSVRLAVLANKDYLPSAGSSARMYIRPYMKGLEGGYGVGPADSYLFGVAVFPFGSFLGSRDTIIDIIGQPGKRRSHQGGLGAVKASGNYGQTILDRARAKTGCLTGDGRIYQDVFYLGEQKKSWIVDGVQCTTTQDVLDEDSAGNLLFLGSDGAGRCTLFTPPLEREAILPGVTRASLLTLARYGGLQVVEQELTLADLKRMHVAFASGTALGIVRIGSMTCGSTRIEFCRLPGTSTDAPPAVHAYSKMFDLLMRVRRGDLRGIAQNGIGEWARSIGMR